MYSIIAPSFFQKKKCVLPGIGSLSLITHSAETDFPNARIKAPRQEIIFTPGTGDTRIFNEFSAISEMMKKNLEEEGSVELLGLGTFSRNSAGEISFYPIQISDDFIQPVNAARVIHKDTSHAILDGDKETTNVEMAEFLTEETLVKDRWWIWALILAFAGLTVLAYYIYRHGFNFPANTHSL